MEELVGLAGVGRKTANVVLGNAFGKPGLAVDTHVARLCQRLGLTQKTDPVRIESEVTALLPPEDWALFGLRLIHHVRQVCHARKPLCEGCTLAPMCPKLGLRGMPGPPKGGGEAPIEKKSEADDAGWPLTG
jgi:endonuclease-3